MTESSTIPSRQEMFSRAWRGLKTQGFMRATRENGSCVYRTGDGKRCAWGHVDPEGTEHRPIGTVSDLRYNRVGLAAHLDESDLAFATELQIAHDSSADSSWRMEVRMRSLARAYDLLIPDEEGVA